MVAPDRVRHVLFVVNNYPPKIGGVELHVQALAGALVRRGGIRVSVWSLDSAPGWSNEDGVEVTRLKGVGNVGDVISLPPRGTLSALRSYVRAEDVDVVSTQTRFFPMSILGARLARQTGLLHLHTEHGSAHVADRSVVMRLGARLVDRTLGRWTLRSADRVLGVSREVCKFVEELAGVKALLFYNGIDVELWSRARALPPRPAHLVFVGRLVSGKGWDDFLEVVRMLRLSGRLREPAVVFGDGPDRDKVRTAIVRMGLEGAVEVRGALPPDQLAAELGGAILVNPSTLSEGFQTTVLEAVAAGGSVASYPVPSAAALRESPAPVTITDRTPTALVAAVRALLEAPPQPLDSEALATWDWSARADQFVEIVSSTRDAA